MHVHAAQRVAQRDHLEVVDHRVIALGFGLTRFEPRRGRMGAGGDDRKAMLGSDAGHDAAQRAELRMGRCHVGMRCGCDLDLRLQHFAGDLPAAGALRREARGLEKRRRHGASERLGLGIDEEILLLDAKAEIVLHGPHHSMCRRSRSQHVSRQAPPKTPCPIQVSTNNDSASAACALPR